MPVVGDDRQLLGVISRHDVIKALHWVNRMPQGGDTIEDEIVKNMVEVDNGETAKQYRVRVTPQMTNQFRNAQFRRHDHAHDGSGGTVRERILQQRRVA